VGNWDGFLKSNKVRSRNILNGDPVVGLAFIDGDLRPDEACKLVLCFFAGLEASSTRTKAADL